MIRERFPEQVQALLGSVTGDVLDLGASAGAGNPPDTSGALYDTIVCIDVLASVDDLDTTVQRLAEVIAPDGRLLFAEPEPWSPSVGRIAALLGRPQTPDVRAALWRNGFTVTDSRPWRRRFTRRVVGGVARLTPTDAATRS